VRFWGDVKRDEAGVSAESNCRRARGVIVRREKLRVQGYADDIVILRRRKRE